MARIENDNSSLVIDEGVFLQTATIIEIEDKSNNPALPDGDESLNMFKSGKRAELYWIVKCEVGDFTRSFFLMGSYIIDKVTGDCKGIYSGNSNRLLTFLIRLLENDKRFRAVTDRKSFAKAIADKTFMIDSLLRDSLIGKKFKFLSYPTELTSDGKLYTDVAHFYSDDEDVEFVRKEWNSTREFFKKYNPMAYTQKKKKEVEFKPNPEDIITEEDPI